MERDKINAGLARNPPNCGRTGGYTPQLITAGRRAPVQPIRTETQYLSSQSKLVKKTPVQPNQICQGTCTLYNHSKQGLSSQQSEPEYSTWPLCLANQNQNAAPVPAFINRTKNHWPFYNQSGQDLGYYWCVQSWCQAVLNVRAGQLCLFTKMRFDKYISYTVYVICFSPFKISEGRLESNPECSRSKRARYWFSQHSPCNVFLHEA